MSRKRAADQWNQHDWFRSLLEAAPDAMIIVGAGGSIRHVNRQAELMFGYSRDELIGQSIELLIPVGLRERHRRQREEFFARPAVRPMGAGLNLRGLRKDGSDFPVEISLSPLESGEGMFVTAAVRDISDRQVAEAALHRAERLASLGTLTAGIAHEINNPVGAVLLTAESALAALRESGSVAEVETSLREIVRSMERCGEIVQNILRFSKEDSGEKSVCDLNQIMRHLLDYVRPYADRHGCVVDLRLPDHPVPLMANPLEIELMVINLVRNAIEAAGSVVEISVHPMPESRRIKLVVTDNGRGMNEEEQNHAFDPFYTTRTLAGGTGLGMSIVYGVVEDHAGTVSIESTAGNGTSVEVTLPSADNSDGEDEPDPLTVFTLVPSVVINSALLGSNFSPLDDAGSPFDGMLIYQRRTDRRPIVLAGVDLLGGGMLEGTVYSKWGEVIFAGKGSYDMRFVAGSIRFANLLECTIAPQDLLPPAYDVFLVE